MNEIYSSELHRFISEWLRGHDTNWHWLLSRAKMSSGSGTYIKKGVIPRPATLERLAKVMGVEPYRLFAVAGYVPAKTEEPELTAAETRLLEEFRALSPRYRDVVLRVAQAMLRSGGDSDEE